MSKSSGQKDPSMDEILGSIRRIITEDNAQAGPPAESPEGAAAEQDDILDLTDVLETAPEPENRREPILKPVEAAPPDSDAETENERREPVLGIHSPTPAAPAEPEAAPSEAVEAAAPERPATEPAEPGPPAARPADSELLVAKPAPPAAESTVEEPEAAAESPPETAPLQQEEEPVMATSDEPPATPADQPPAAGETIVSEPTSSATTAALGELSRAMEEKMSRLRLGEGDATVSEIVKELLRPMLRQWIDENLPVIVERVVRREIQKLVDRTPADD